jgi:hypothetical protein
VSERETAVERPWLHADCCPRVVEGRVNRVTSHWWYQRRVVQLVSIWGGGREGTHRSCEARSLTRFGESSRANAPSSASPAAYTPRLVVTARGWGGSS